MDKIGDAKNQNAISCTKHFFCANTHFGFGNWQLKLFLFYFQMATFVDAIAASRKYALCSM